jgi:hypothetical protein
MRLTNIAPLASMLGARSGMCFNAISYELSERPEDMIESSELAPVADDKPRMAYLDVCALNRPLDDQSQMRMRLEAARFLSLPRQRLLDYVQWHRQWQTSLDQKSFFDTVFGADNLDA